MRVNPLLLAEKTIDLIMRGINRIPQRFQTIVVILLLYSGGFILIAILVALCFGIGMLISYGFGALLAWFLGR